MMLVIRDEAARDLEAIFDYIARDNIAAAGSVVDGLRERMNVLAHPEFAEMGRHGRAPRTRELVEGPYIIVYEVEARGRGKAVTVLTVVHGARER
jgi:toxin ParE1/3/4